MGKNIPEPFQIVAEKEKEGFPRLEKKLSILLNIIALIRVEKGVGLGPLGFYLGRISSDYILDFFSGGEPYPTTFGDYILCLYF